ncbi:MAG: PcfJ domain-containing protein [Bacillus sp. (in: Bacteria)]|nr:PcfJ domain-containing protein [Parasporobacterium sp.]MBR3381017.1 PcfJ domain-containing protein [Bacillus sp. (in: firmicutes)]
MSNENISTIIQEIQSAGMDWKQVAQIAAMLKQQEKQGPQTEVPTVVVVSDKPTYSVEISYPDLILTKTKNNAVSRAVICVSQNSYYIQTNKKIIPLTEEGWANFTSGMQTISLQNYWIPILASGKTYYNLLSQLFYNPITLTGIKNRAFPRRITEDTIEDVMAHNRSSWKMNATIHNYESEAAIFQMIKPVYPEFCASCFNNSAWFGGTVAFIYHRYGPEKAKDFIKTADMSLIKWGTNGYENNNYTRSSFFMPNIKKYCNYQEVVHRKELYIEFLTQNKFSTLNKDSFFNGFMYEIPAIDMEYEKLRDYLLFDSYRMGYSKIDDFLGEWNDTLFNEQIAFNKIREKYPAHLKEYHDIIARIVSVVEQEEQDKKVSEYACKIKPLYETTIGDYIFIVPNSSAEMLDEASQQANCLAGYVSRVAEGETSIVFMRRKESPEQSLITIEICGDCIRQALRAYNRQPDAEEINILKKYAKKIGVDYEP